jgi:peptidoglycan/LPS O-acetylase OafA/YrhL
MVFATHTLNLPLFWMGVDLFFVISGYLITKILLSLKERDANGESYWTAFYFRRMQRILPPYVVFLVVLSGFYSVCWKQSWYCYLFFDSQGQSADGC